MACWTASQRQLLPGVTCDPALHTRLFLTRPTLHKPRAPTGSVVAFEKLIQTKKQIYHLPILSPLLDQYDFYDLAN